MKATLTGKSKIFEGVKVYQIENKDEIGGWVESLDNIENNGFVADNAVVLGESACQRYCLCKR